MRSAIAALIFVAAVLLPRGAAHADPLAAVERANQFAIENIDLGDFEGAHKALVEAFATLDANGMAQKPVAGKSHMLMGVVYAMGLGDPERGFKHMVRAIELDEKVQLDSHADAATQELWAKAQNTVNPVIDCNTLEGISHHRVLSTDAGVATMISAKVGKGLHDGAVVVRYRVGGAGAFAELTMEKRGDCDFVATVPADKVVPPSFIYFIQARSQAGKLLAAQGSEARPFLVEVTQLQAAPDDRQEMKRQEDEVPDVIQVGKGKGSGCAGCASGGPGAAGWLAALAVAALVGRRRRRRV